ncbi:MAG: DUF4326 domain-containing protein [Promethearchaeia archaeon]
MLIIANGKTIVVDIHKRKGKRPKYDIYIGRKVRNTEFTKDSIWANPRLTLEEYELYILDCIDKYPEIYDLNELKGKRLGCWCITTDKIYPLRCHGQVLLKIMKERGLIE